MTKTEARGRPLIELGSEQIMEMQRLAPVATTTQIADAIGVSRAAFFKILRRDKTIYGLYKKARMKGLDFASGKLMKKIAQGDSTSILFYLKTQWGWSEKPKDDDFENEDKRKELKKITISVKKNENEQRYR